jgi:hypothetical protein
MSGYDKTCGFAACIGLTPSHRGYAGPRINVVPMDTILPEPTGSLMASRALVRQGALARLGGEERREAANEDQKR